LCEAFVVGGRCREKQEQIKNKIGVTAKLMLRWAGAALLIIAQACARAVGAARAPPPAWRRLSFAALQARSRGRVTAGGRSFVQRPRLLRAVIASSRFL
jgi:hypothetical protein